MVFKMKVAVKKNQPLNHPHTVNGKLVILSTDRIKDIDDQLKDVIKQLKSLEIERIAAEQRDRKEYINQLKLLKYSVKNIEHLYRKLLVITITISTISTVLSSLSVVEGSKARASTSFPELSRRVESQNTNRSLSGVEGPKNQNHSSTTTIDINH